MNCELVEHRKEVIGKKLVIKQDEIGRSTKRLDIVGNTVKIQMRKSNKWN